MNMLMTSVFAILLAMTFLASSTWAWFSTDLTTGTPSTIRTSSYQIKVLDGKDSVGNALKETVDQGSSLTVYHFHTESETTLAAGTYTFTVEAEGTGNGYCKVVVTTVATGGSGTEELVSFTKPIPTGATYTFDVKLNNTATVKIIPVWGSYSGEASIAVAPVSAGG
ncbi:MAG: hypothetical protein E7620_09430 [Ruminococcaceae bacterium]|nr:hypothetical protein [Oscillospiraceae bacterium]